MPGLVALVASLARRAAFAARYAMARRRLTAPDECEVLKLRLRVEPGVFHPGFFPSSRLLASYLGALDLRGRRVLDMGTGSGIAALVAARAGARVVAADVAPAAVACARANAARNGLGGSIEVLRSDLFDGLSGRGPFDLVAWNPPFYPRAARDDADRAWAAGGGFETLRRFAREGPPFLAPAGAILLVLTSDVAAAPVLASFSEAGLAASVAAEKRLLFERLTLYRFSKGG